MSFTPDQKTALAAPLNSGHVKTRAQAGRQLSYIEGWWAISEANRIFGFDGWTRETVELKCVSEHQRKVGQGDGWGVTYIARVRITVGEITREGCGTGHGIDRDLGQAHESALKESETDAMKRALMTFGNPFGLALYDKEQNGVEHGNGANGNGHAKPVTPIVPKTDADILAGMRNWVDQQKDIIIEFSDMDSLENWLKKHASCGGREGNWDRPTPSSPLDKILKFDPKLFNELKKYYLEKLVEI